MTNIYQQLFWFVPQDGTQQYTKHKAYKLLALGVQVKKH
jgi:hypothetical protein